MVTIFGLYILLAEQGFLKNIIMKRYQGNNIFFLLICSSAESELLAQRQLLGTGNLPQDSAPVCNIIDISPEMAAQSAQRNQAFCVTASDWSPIITSMKALC